MRLHLAPMKTFSVAQVRAGLAGLLVKAQNETVIIARYGKPIGLLLGFPPSTGLDDIRAMAAQLQAGFRQDRGAPPPRKHRR